MELAAEVGFALPTMDRDELARWFTIVPGMSFPEAWQRFYVVIAVLQSPEALHRVAREAVADLAADDVAYAELRFAPLNHLSNGLTGDDVMSAVCAGLADGESDTGCVARAIVCGLRENDPNESVAAAELAVRWKDRGVVGFDLAGNEFDYAAGPHRDAFAIARDGGLGITVHAGEMAGPESIADGVAAAQPSRIGHGLNLIADCEVDGGRIAALGDVARVVQEQNLMLEVCVTSNSCLGTPVDRHPVRMYHDAGFRLSVNPDDRAITTTTVGREYDLWREHHGFNDAEFQSINLDALDAAFCDHATKHQLLSVIEQGWAAVSRPEG